MMGHGRQFKQVKWPATWYGAYEVVDVLGRLPETWRANPQDRRSLAEIAAVDVMRLASSKGGSGTPLPPKGGHAFAWRKPCKGPAPDRSGPFQYRTCCRMDLRSAKSRGYGSS